MSRGRAQRLRSSSVLSAWSRRASRRAVAIEAALVPGGVEIAPLGQGPGGLPQGVERLGSVALLPPREPREGAHQGGRRSSQALLDPALKHAAEDAQGLRLRQLLKYRIDARFHRTAAQQLRAERVDGADEGAVQRARRFGQAALHQGIELARAPLLQLVAYPQFHIARRGMRERDGHDLLDRRSGGDHLDDAVHQRGRLAGAGGGFHHPALVEPGREAGTAQRHVRSSFSPFNSGCDFSATRSSS